MNGALGFRNCGSVLITGASRGLGLQMVETLASGAFSPGKIIATARNPAAAQKLQEVAQKYPNIHIITLDVVSQESIDKAVEAVAQLVKEDGLNCLINNAGVNVVADFHNVTPDMMIENYHTNTVAPVMITKAFLPLLKQAASRGGAGGSATMGIHRAAVINISSMLGSVALSLEMVQIFKYYPYRASKSALNMMSRCMAADLKPDGILCMAIHPGWVRTDMGGADLSTEESITATLSVIGGLTEKDHGSFLSYTGEVLPW
ncbi:C-factor-like isoform X2 [Mastacembelus armatus]|uniref:C-factor-like isoform X2 n=1 Tax=Mastacembelus armatus TaxID=205130 RepID=UPI000E456465|nr:C-factor-like isoform X2 [Mastacembelus armatus]